MASSTPSLLLHLLLLFLFLSSSYSQQPYINNVQDNCYGSNASSALGYSCNGAEQSCTSFLTFRAESPYLSPAVIAFLLSADATNISRLNSVTDVASLSPGELIFIPIPCSCSNQFYQHNASYTIKAVSENYLTIANDTYQGLSTCQALMDQNPFDSRKLAVGYKLVVPLRCVCPTLNQTRAGIKYLLSYLIDWGDDVSNIAHTFKSDYQSILDANELSEKSTIYPFTTLLVPLTTEPTALSSSRPSPGPSVSGTPPPPAGDSGSSHTGLFVGIGVGVGLLLLVAAVALFFCIRSRMHPPQKGEQVSHSEYDELPFKSTSLSSSTTPYHLASGLQGALDWMTVYKFEELQKATDYFDEKHRIKGSVYRGVINGDAAAIKRLKGDVSNEINILKQISHSNLIKLSGFCLHEGDTYMVYEYVEMGSLSDWLHHMKNSSDSSCLTWNHRIQFACDVADGLNYLHNYTNPPYIHKNLKSSNVLIAKDFRAKVANFGLAKAVADEEGPQQLTRHVVGTQGYLAPEYLEHGLITPKLDVFAFGVVLLELLSGKEATFQREGEEKGEILLSSTIEDVLSGEDVRSNLRGFIDRCLRDDYPFDLAYATAELAKRCLSRDFNSRPTMNELLISLSAIYNSTLDWNPEGETTSRSASTIYSR
ncbi:protein LYK5 [Phalaenopsis equestris]|uniref:protein LYK5 n=1 Tax=Phalaenopsis equestris TaxID=78828 RepID=UPI0009E3A2E9|nr:protein LYK5 [Phalaenopsis equestris]